MRDQGAVAERALREPDPSAAGEVAHVEREGNQQQPCLVVGELGDPRPRLAQTPRKTGLARER